MSDANDETPRNPASPTVPALLHDDSVIRFRCHEGIACFNACCRHADVTLAPFDVLRLQQRLGMDSAAFLNAYTVPFEFDAEGVPGIRLRTDNDGACLFLDGDNGCSVYTDRPTVCRYYPLALLNMHVKDTGGMRQHYSLVREPHCLGHDVARDITVRDYRAEQGIEDYDRFNRGWYELIVKKRSGGPAVGKPTATSLQLFFMASFNFDMLRRFVLSDSFKATYDLPDETYAALAVDDTALIVFGNRLMRQALFGEKTIPEQRDAWERRVGERKALWEVRARAGMEAHRPRPVRRTGDED